VFAVHEKLNKECYKFFGSKSVEKSIRDLSVRQGDQMSL
jgi:hypothetical protein